MKIREIIISCVLLISTLGINGFSIPQKNLTSQQTQELDKLLDQAREAILNSNLNEACRCYSRAGYLLWTTDNYEEAIDAYLNALKYNEELGNTNAIKVISGNLGLIYTDIEDYQNSLKYFNKSLDIKKNEGKKIEIASDLLNIANVLKSMNKISEANEQLLEAIEILKEINELKLLKRAYGMLAENYEQAGNTEKSFEYFNLYSSIDKYLKQKQIEETQEKTKSEIRKMEGITQKAIDDKKATEVELVKKGDSLKIAEEINKEITLQNELKSKRIELQDAKLRNKALTLNFIIGASGLLLVIAFILFRGFQQKKKSNALLAMQNKEILEQKDEISKQNSNITNSINYARRIQNALLPPTELLSDFVDDSLIYFRPRDIVSGDFYWFSDTKLRSVLSKYKSTINKEKQSSSVIKEIMVSAVDCTGHGVPGALMSMIGNNLLHEIISNGIIRPSDILTSLHKGIITQLKQNDKSEVQDGMDLAICFVNKEKKVIEYAGAKNPIVYFKNGQLYRIKGDNHSIGGQIFKNEKRNFTNHVIHIDEPLTVYLFSDGYIDQLGGEEGKKFFYTRFSQLLTDVHKLPFEEQSEVFDKTLKEWRGENFSQLDDILIIGFRIS